MTLKLLALSAMLLGGCASVTPSTDYNAVKTLQNAAVQSLTVHNQYNFESVQTIESKPRAVSASDVQAALKCPKEGCAEQVDKGFDLGMDYIFGHAYYKVTGAVDLPGGKIEAIPELKYQTQNSQVMARLPIQLNMRERALLVKADALAPFGGFSSMRKIGLTPEVMDKKVLRFHLPEKTANKIPVKSLMHALPIAVNEVFSSLNTDEVRAMAMDDFGRQVGAMRRIRVDMNAHTTHLLTHQLFRQTSFHMRREPSYDANVSQKDYDAFVNLINPTEDAAQTTDAWQKIIARLPESEKASDNAAIQEAREKVDQDAAGAKKWLLNGWMDVYLNGRGEIVAMQQKLSLPPLDDALSSTRKTHAFVTRIRLTNYRAPVFTLNPRPNELFEVQSKEIDDEINSLSDKALKSSEAEQAESTANKASVTVTTDTKDAASTQAPSAKAIQAAQDAAADAADAPTAAQIAARKAAINAYAAAHDAAAAADAATADAPR